MKTLLRFSLPISILVIYAGVFFGDLGGIGGYDNFAPKWLYEKVMYSDNPLYFKISENLSIFLMAVGIVMFFSSILLYIYVLIKKLYLKKTKKFKQT